MKGEDLAGRRFGGWEVLYCVGRVASQPSRYWLCRCRCGREVPVRGDRLVSGGSTRCLSCVARARLGCDGPDGPLTSGQRDLADDHVGLAMDVARRWWRTRPWLEDEIKSEATFALVLAARSYRDESSDGFRDYARRIIHWALMVVLRDLRGTHGSHVVTWSELGRFPDHRTPDREYRESRESFEHMVGMVSPKNRPILRRNIEAGDEFTDIARDLGIPYHKVKYRYKRAIGELRARVSSGDLEGCTSIGSGRWMV